MRRVVGARAGKVRLLAAMRWEGRQRAGGGIWRGGLGGMVSAFGGSVELFNGVS